ncbi:quinon protein alcohol dehydrogenase-like superfamily, partial [Suillus spraguei]
MTLTPVLTLEGHKEHVRSISYFPDSKQMISASMDKTARRWDLQEGKEIEEARDVFEQGVFAVAVSKDGRWIITAGGDFDHGGPGEIKAYEVETGIMKTFRGHERMVTCIDSSTNSTLLASGSWDGTARVWNLDTGKLMGRPFKSEDWPGAVLFSSDSKKLAVNFKDDDIANTVYEFDATTLQTSGAPFEGHTKIVTGLALSFDGAILASASDDNTIKFWAFTSQMILTPVEMSDEYYQSDNITSIAYFPDGKQMFSGSSDKITRRWDLESGKEIEEARDVCEEEITAVAVSRDGRWVITGGGRGKRPELKACEVETGMVKRFEGHSRSIICIDISADSTLLASGSYDSTARIWNLETGK